MATQPRNVGSRRSRKSQTEDLLYDEYSELAFVVILFVNVETFNSELHYSLNWVVISFWWLFHLFFQAEPKES